MRKYFETCETLNEALVDPSFFKRVARKIARKVAKKAIRKLPEKISELEKEKESKKIMDKEIEDLSQKYQSDEQKKKEYLGR